MSDLSKPPAGATEVLAVLERVRAPSKKGCVLAPARRPHSPLGCICAPPKGGLRAGWGLRERCCP